MPNNDSHLHVVKTTAQWEERSVEFWVVPRGCLCVELTPKGKTKLKIGEGSKYYSQLPYICDGHDLSQYYTKNEIDNLFENLNRMAIMSTNEYDSKSDLPLNGNKLGDVRFVKSSSPSVKTDPDIYLWDGSKWVFVGYEFKDIDLSQYLKKDEFHEAFDPVKIQVDEMYPIRHTHLNKDILDNTTASYTIPEKEKLAGLKNYDDTEIRKLIHDSSHTHDNKDLLDTITPESLWSEADRKKFESIVDYGDDIIEIRADIKVLYDMAHTHDNKDILDKVEEPYTTAEKEKLAGLSNPEVFIGTDGFYPGKEGIVPAPSVLDVGKFLSSNGTWMPAGGELLPATTDTLGGIKVGAGLLMTDDDHLRLDATAIKTYYDAGEGIEIVADGGYVDPINGHFLSKLNYLTQYVIYGAGTSNGVGDGSSEGYIIPMTIKAEGRDDLNASILIPQQLFAGDYIDFRNQLIHYSRTLLAYSEYGNRGNMNVWWGSYYGDIGWNGRYYSNGEDADWFYYPIKPGMNYAVISYASNTYNFGFIKESDLSVGCRQATYYNVFQVVPGVLTFATAPDDAAYIICPGNSHNIYRFTMQLYEMSGRDEHLTLPTVFTHPNVENVLTINTSVKPSNVFIETSDPEEDIESGGSMIGVIYNKGVLDVTQEDPENLNELTIHFQKNETKIIEIPKGEYTLPIASEEKLGGIKVGAGLEIDPETGVLDVIPGEKMYSEIDDAKVFTLLREKPDDWDSFWMEYFSMDYFELTEKPEKFDPTKHYKYMNDAYVRGEPTDTWEGPIWYDKHYSSLPLTEYVEFIPDLYYTSKLIQPTDGETIGESLSKINEDLQQLSGRIDNKVSVKMKDDTSENLMFF